MAASKPPKDFMGMCEYYLVTKAPFQLPKALKEFIVQWGPWITLVILVVTLPALLVVFGLSAALLPFAAVTGTGFSIVWALSLVGIVLEAISLPGLFARKLTGWNFAFYAVLVGALGSLLSGAIFSAIADVVIGSYILFQIKSYYK